MSYIELPHNKKLNLLNEHDGGWKDLEQHKWCLHCSRSFTGLSTRVWQDDDGRLWLECGTPGCDGSPIDWAPYPWWDPDHPATKAYLDANPGERRKYEERRTDDGGEGDDDGDIPF